VVSPCVCLLVTLVSRAKTSKGNDGQRASTARTLSGDGLMKVWRLGSCENFVGK